MRLVSLILILIAASESILGQATVTSFLGNGQAPIGAAVGIVGSDVGNLPIEPQHLAVDQAGNVLVNVGSSVMRVNRGRILQGQQAGFAAFPLRGIAVDPFGKVAAMGERCLFIAAPPANGFSFTQTFGSCLFDPADAGDGTSNPRFRSTDSVGIDRQGVVYIWDNDAGRVRLIGTDGIVRAVNSSVRLNGSIRVMPANGESGVISCDINGNTVRLQPTGITPFPLQDFLCGNPFTFDLDDNLYHFRLSDFQLVRRTPAGAVSLVGLGLRGRSPFREGIPASDLDIGGDLQRASIAADTAGNIYFTRGRSSSFADPLTWRVLRIQFPSAARPDCTFSLSPSTPISASGGRIPIAVRPNTEGCYWQIISQDPWIRVPAAASAPQRGARSIDLEFDANSGGDRVGAIFINGQRIAVTQTGSGAATADSGVITTFAGRADVFGGLAPLPADVSSLLLSFPSDIAFDSANNAYIVEQGRYRVLQIAANGAVRIAAGTGLLTYAPQSGGPAAQTVLSFPFSVTVDNNNRVNITENYLVRRFAPGGNIETFLQYLAPPASPAPLGLNDLVRWDRFQNRLLITYRINNDGNNHILSVRGTERTQLNRGSGPSSPDGTPFDEASLGGALAIGGPDGAIYISEVGENRIRRAMPGGRLETIAGTGVAASNGDGGPAKDAAIFGPLGMVFDSLGNLYVAESRGHRIRRIRTDGVIETVAGNGQNRTGGDGGSPVAASIAEPSMLAIDATGNLYVAQRRAYVIRKIVLPRQRPSINVSGLTSFAGTRAFAPGAMFTLRGVNMTSANATSEANPLPRSLGGVLVLINGAAVPLESVSPGSIRGQIPYEVEPGLATLRVESGGNATNEIAVEILPAAPGILTRADGRAVATNEDGSPNSDELPAQAGSLLTVTLTGIGLVDPAVETGAVAPDDPPSTAVLEAAATIGEAPALVDFIGLVPGMVGIAQARLVPSADLPSGNHQVRITINGVTSNAPMVSIRSKD